MNDCISIIERLGQERHLSSMEYAMLLSPSLPDETVAMLTRAARKLTDATFGNKVRVRGLLEITNVCRNNCLYCGLRRDNRDIRRYTLPDDVILSACQSAYATGFRTFVLQGGENPALTGERISLLVWRIHTEFPDAAITLSLGEWPDDALLSFRQAGASRYLLRHETHNQAHYGQLHPSDMSLDNRLRCIATLKRLGFQTGTGIMVGSPYQTTDHIIEDLHYMHSIQPEMIGIGPFIPNSATPFAKHPHGSIELTTRLISILRLMFPNANIPSTTALASLSPDGRNKGLAAGANVVMPNITPMDYRKDYSIYDNKAAYGSEAAEGLALLSAEVAEIGLELTTEKGDYK